MAASYGEKEAANCEVVSEGSQVRRDALYSKAESCDRGRCSESLSDDGGKLGTSC